MFGDLEQDISKIAPGSTVTYNERTRSLTILVKSRYVDEVSEYMHIYVPSESDLEINIITEE